MSNINIFATLSNLLWRKIQNQGSKHRSVISMLNNIFRKHFSIFNIFAHTAANFIKLIHCLDLELYIYPFAFYIVCFCCLLLFFLFVCLFVCLCGYDAIITSVSCIFISMDFHFFLFLWVGILYYNFIII